MGTAFRNFVMTGRPSSPFGQVLPALPEGVPMASPPGSNAHAVVDAMLGTPKAPTVADAFDVILKSLHQHQGLKTNSDLIGELSDLSERIEERLASQRQARRAESERKHADLYSACRNKLDEVRQLQTSVSQLQGRLNTLGQHVSRHRANLAAAEGSKPAAATYPTKAELRQWADLCGKTRAELAPYLEQESELRTELAEAVSDLRRASAELQTLQGEEQTLLAELEGRAHPGPFGLIAPAQTE
jgi:chromosome segregation ATPase